ncbi:MAG TPA: signal peptidase I [Clostridiales bacterium]|nr:signal peptidase I [Clostridiales bacterium]
MKKHNREQENSQPEKHSWFKSKKDEVKQEVTEEVKEEVSEEVTDVAEDVAEDAEKVTDVATNDEIIEKVAEDVAESAGKVTDVATSDEIIEKVAEDVAENAEKVTDVATSEADVEESEAGTAADAIAELVAESNPEPKPETESETNSISEAAAIIPVAALAELAKPEDSEIAELESGAETESDATVGESKENEESEAEDEEETDKEESDEDEEESDEDEDEETDKKAAKAKKKDREESQKEKSALYMFFDTIKFVAIGLLIGILLVVFVIQRNDVYGSSMEPTLYSGDAVFVEMISVYTGNFDRGDIITIDAKGMEGYSHEENLIKRIVGLPGETIKIADGDVYINGQLLDESDYLPAGTKTYVGAEGQSRGYDEMTLGPDEYYCMGDNRGGSNDSRRMGPFKKSQIDAKVLARIYPFNKMKFF